MLAAIHSWMTGPYAGKTMLVLRILFFGLFAATAVVLSVGAFRNGGKKGKGGLHLLVVLFCLAIAGLFCRQMQWQVLGARNPKLMRFIRQHNKRAGVEIHRGSILDRDGRVLACDDGMSRKYPLGRAAAHVVGYYDATYGIAGVEKIEDAGLIVNGGNDLRLTLDARLQAKAYELLAGRRGAVVALNAATGEILVLASSPSFDPHKPGAYYGDSEDAPFLNRATRGAYPAGSTFKVFMSLAAQEAGISPVFNTPPGGFCAEKAAKPIRDVEYYEYARAGKTWGGFGKIGMRDALVHSSNVYFAQLGLALPPDVFNSKIDLLGIRGALNVYGAAGAMNAVPAGMPVVADGDRRMRAQLAIGQGKMLVAPIHVAMWTAVAANGGVLAAPRLSMRDPVVTKRIVSKKAADTVAGYMRQAVLSGTGRAADIPGLGICGKTGTAQVANGADHSWFTCYSSEGSTRIVVTALVEHGGYGARAALPIASGVMQEALSLGVVRAGVREGAAK